MNFARVVRAVFGVLLLTSATACNNPAAPANLAAFSQKDLQIGSGPAAEKGNVLSVNYTGWLYDVTKTDQKGPVFDTTTGRGPFSFTLGTNEVIPGWDQGIVGMQVGGIRRLVIPPSLAYGSVRNSAVPPNSTLIFEVELLSIQ